CSRIVRVICSPPVRAKTNSCPEKQANLTGHSGRTTPVAPAPKTARDTAARAIHCSDNPSSMPNGDKGPADPAIPLVATVNANWRVVDHLLQWRLQRKRGNPRTKNSGWQDRSYYTTQEGLLRCVREYCDEVRPGLLAVDSRRLYLDLRLLSSSHRRASASV